LRPIAAQLLRAEGVPVAGRWPIPSWLTAYHLLSRRQPQQDLGSNSFAERERAAIARQSVRRREQRGFQVTLHAAEEVA
jgi:hypothetical protein